MFLTAIGSPQVSNKVPQRLQDTSIFVSGGNKERKNGALNVAAVAIDNANSRKTLLLT